MDGRALGRSGLRVSTLTLGTTGFGGQGPFRSVGGLGVEDCRRQLDLCVDAGVNRWTRRTCTPAASRRDRVGATERAYLGPGCRERRGAHGTAVPVQLTVI